jgi:general secretion pathway protein F/type IV pilus assembly protein PilC
MPDFSYIARNAAGERVAGTLSSASERETVAVLGAQGLYPLQVTASGNSHARRGSLRVRPQAMSRFYSQLASLLRSGVPLLRSLKVLRAQSSVPALRQILDDLHGRVEDGEALATAMARHPRAFSELATSIVRAGGEGGFLEEALQRVAKFTDQQAELKSRVMGALAYPIFLAVFGFTVVTVLVIFFVPKFETLFGRLRARGEMPMLTDWLLWLSSMLSRYGLLLVGAVVIITMVVRMQLQTDAGRWLVDRMRLQLPQVGTIYRNLAVSRFCRVLGTLLRGGVPIVRALQISADSTGNRVLAAAIHDAAENITAGQSLAAPLEASGHFPPDVIEMVSVAEQANTLETVLTDISDSLERETWRRLDLFVRLLEPFMLLVMASAVLVVVVALLLPMLKSAMAM